MLATSLLVGGMLAGCVDDNLYKEVAGTESIYDIDDDEFAMGVTISLNHLTGKGSRAISFMNSGELKDIEEYVNTDNLYVLFFNLEGTFLFQINKPVAIPIGQSALGNDNQWFIKIPVKDINPNLIKYIEDNPFKIAVLANWTFDSDINLGENLGGWDEFRFNEPVDAEGNLVYDEITGKLKGDHISLLSHAELDMVYENLDVKGYDHLAYRTETGPHMGPYTEWVANYHRNIPQAATDIRNNYDVAKNQYTNPGTMYENGDNNHFKTVYKHLWHLWSFGGTDESHYEFIAGDSQKTAWLNLNEASKEGFVAQFLEMTSDPIGPSSYYEKHGEFLRWQMPNYQDLEMTYGVVPSFKEVNRGTEEEPVMDIDIDGVILKYPNISVNDNADGNPLNLKTYSREDFYYQRMPHPYIHFKAYADGYLRINYEAFGGAKLYVHIGNNNTPENNASGYQRDNKKNRSECTIGDDGQFGDIPFDPKDVYIYMVADMEGSTFSSQDMMAFAEGEEQPSLDPKPAIKIYGIEYIESRHLYDVDRRGILPTKEYPIPMYGIQDFDAIGEYWEPGVLFNLSQFNNGQRDDYNYRHISLLRSLAKVEVKLLKSAFKKKPSHVYLRSMNRSARITPVDFITPTDIIWNGFNPGSVSDVKRLQNYINEGNLTQQHIIENTPGHKGEVDNIMQYGPIYIGTNGNQGQSDKDKLQEYRKTTAWPFGIWEKQWNWNWSRETEYVDWFDTYQVGQTRAHTGQRVPEYPRILHTRISRSDYARFTEVETNDGYWHYIIYVPEKNITDADNPGDIADRPKIVHVELRFNDGLPVMDEDGNPSTEDPENQVDNFDDNGAYRLYFTPGGRASLGKFEFNGRESWDAYEYDLDIVKQHWPILRNHEYIFEVTGSPNKGNVNFQVSAPDQRVTGWVFY